MTASFQLRPGRADDVSAVFDIFRDSLRDLGQRQNVNAITGDDSPETRARIWELRRPYFEHLYRTAHAFWLAERNGVRLGYARSILRDDSLELTEFFVLPGEQSAGIGRALLDKVFAAGEVRHRSIIATLDVRAQARYLKAGVYPRFPLIYMGRPPKAGHETSELGFRQISLADHVGMLDQIDKEILGYRRSVDHELFDAQKDGFLYLRGDDVVGYGYVGRNGAGPMALLETADFPAALAHAENSAAEMGATHFGVEVPMINEAAVDYLMARDYQLDNFVALYMSSGQDGRLDHYIANSPPYFM